MDISRTCQELYEGGCLSEPKCSELTSLLDELVKKKVVFIDHDHHQEEKEERAIQCIYKLPLSINDLLQLSKILMERLFIKKQQLVQKLQEVFLLPHIITTTMTRN